MRLLIGVMLAGSAFLVGCNATATDLTLNDRIAVQADTSGSTRFYAVSARQSGSDLIVSGSVRRAYADNTPIIVSHVDVAAYDASGKLLSTVVASPSIDSPSIRSSRSSTFSAKLPIQAQDGTVVRLEHHFGSECSTH